MKMQVFIQKVQDAIAMIASKQVLTRGHRLETHKWLEAIKGQV